MLIGGGGHALVVAEAARAAGRAIAGVFDDRSDAPAITRLGLPRMGPLRGAPEAGPWVVCVGDLRVRMELLAAMGTGSAAAAVVHPSAVVSPSATLGAGVFVGPRAVVHSFAKVEAHAIVNTGAIVEHDCVIGVGTHVAPGAIVAGSANVGSGCLLGVGCRVLPRVAIGDGCTVGAGAVVVKVLAAGSRVVGVPARAL